MDTDITEEEATPEEVADKLAAENERLVMENNQLKAQIQYGLQGAVGSPSVKSPDPGMPNLPAF